MPADAYVMDSDMKKVADKIREKSGTTKTLTFPDEFVSELDKINKYDVQIEGTPVTQDLGDAPNLEGLTINILTNRITNPATNYSVSPAKWTVLGVQPLLVDIGGVTDSITVNVQDVPIYGVRIKISDSRPNEAVEYIDRCVGFTPMTRKSPGSWAGNELITGIKPVLRRSDGTWQDLNKRNLASGADISSIGNDVFTRFQTWYLSITTDTVYNYIRFCSKKKDDTYFDLASLYKGKRQGMFHLGCYDTYVSSNMMYSVAGKTPSTRISTEQSRQYAQARGAGFDQVGYYQIMYLQALFVLLFKGRNGQELIGKGYTSGSSITTENRTTYDNEYGMAGSSSGTDQMSFFWINNLWGNVYNWIGGAKVDENKKLMTLDNGQPIHTSGSEWVTQNSSPGLYDANSIIQMDMKSTKIGFFPTSVMGTDYSKDWCDSGGVRASGFPAFGGHYGVGDRAGPFFYLFNYSTSTNGSMFSSRLVYREAVN